MTIEGAAVRDALVRPGIWRRAGINGSLTGLDLNEAVASVPPQCDRERVRVLFQIAELRFLTAHWRSQATKPED